MAKGFADYLPNKMIDESIPEVQEWMAEGRLWFKPRVGTSGKSRIG